MVDEMRKIIKGLSEDDAKSMLYQFWLRTEMVGDSAYTETECVEDIQKTFGGLHTYFHQQAQMKLNCEAIHIAFGESAAGLLKIALKEMGLAKKEYILSFFDNFTMGPITSLNLDDGVAKRHNWLRNHINIDEGYLDDYLGVFKDTVKKIKLIPASVSIHIWVGNNAHEQTGVRFVLKLLAGKEKKISIINTTESVDHYLNQSDSIEYFHTGEIPPEKLKVIYRSLTGSKTPTSSLLSESNRKLLEEEWEKLSADHSVLRTYKNGVVYQVHEAFYDDFIMEAVRPIHDQPGGKGFH